jgi:hypothetical protein
MGSLRRAASLIMMIVLIVSVAVASAEARPLKRPRPRCAVPAHARLVAQDRQFRIIAIISPPYTANSPPREWRYCSRLTRNGRFRDLARAQPEVIIDLGVLTLAGRYVAYSTETTQSQGRYGYNAQGDVYVRDLLTGSIRQAHVAPCTDATATETLCAVGPSDLYCSSPFCGSGPPVLLVTPTGIAVWHGEEKCIDPSTNAWRPCAWTLQALDGRNGWTAVLDSSTPTTPSDFPPDPFGNLQLASCSAGCAAYQQTIATWTRAGAWHVAPLQ